MPIEDYIEKSNTEYWLQNTKGMSQNLVIDNTTKIEEQPDSTIVDFANKFIGGGALTHGTTQEEILFLICPDLFASILMCPKIEDNEAIVFKNVHRFS